MAEPQFKELKRYLTVREMRLFWVFLAFMAVSLIVGFIHLPSFWKFVNLGLFLLVGAIVFGNSVNVAQAHEASAIEGRRLKQVAADLRDGIIMYDQDFKILNVNPAAEQILGLRAGEIVGQAFTLKLKQGAASRYRVLLTVLFPALAPQLIQRSEPSVYPQVVDLTLDDPPLELRVSTSQIKDERGEIVGFLKIVRDRTRELALLRSKSDFITIASHQLRAPLTAIRWAFEGLKKEDLASAQAELVKTGGQAAENLSKIVNDLLDVSKIEEGRFGYQFQEIDLLAFLEAALKEAEPIAREYQVKIYFDRPKEERMNVTVDSQKLSTALSNLIDNAIKYNVSNGEVVVKAERLPDRPYAQVTIRDTGVGIPPEAMDKLFSKFFRGENVFKFSMQGTGLGLYITKNIIRRHGGRIWAESTLSRGSTFFFTLPTDPALIPAKDIVYDE